MHARTHTHIIAYSLFSLGVEMEESADQPVQASYESSKTHLEHGGLAMPTLPDVPLQWGDT